MPLRVTRILTREQALRLSFEVVAIVFSVLFALFVNSWREDRALARTVRRVEQTLLEEVTYNRAAVAKRVEYHVTLAREILEGTRLLRRLTWEELGSSPAQIDRAEAVREILLRQFGEDDPEFDPVVRPAPADAGEGIRFTVDADGTTLKIRLSDQGLDILGSGNVQLDAAWIRNTAWDTMQVTGAALHLDYDLVVEATAVYHLQKAYLDMVATALDLLYAANMASDSRNFAGFGQIVGDMARLERTMVERYDVLLDLLGAPAADDEDPPGADRRD
jgi:hypothetical protein